MRGAIIVAALLAIAPAKAMAQEPTSRFPVPTTAPPTPVPMRVYLPGAIRQAAFPTPRPALPPTQTPYPTYTPLPTYTVPPTATAGTVEPSATPTDRPPTSTRRPSPTASATPNCRNLIRNGGFEEDLAFWDTRGAGVNARTTGDFGTARSGVRFAQVWPAENGELSSVQSTGVTPPLASTIQSATLRYYVVGHSLERLDRLDYFLVTLSDPNALRCSSCRRSIELLYNNDRPLEWRARAFDVTEQLRAGWAEVGISFSAKNDFSDPTWWDIDDVSLEVCSRE